MKSLKVILLIILSVLGSSSLSAQSVRTDTLSVEIPFRRGSSTLELDYNGTAGVMDGFLRSLESLNSNPDIIIHSVNILSAASVEGPRAFNERLSLGRAQSILEFLCRNTTLSPSQMKINSRGENWEDLLRVLEESEQEWCCEASDIIRTMMSDSTDNASQRCKQQLQGLREGKAWEWMEENVFPSLRSAGGSVHVITSTVRELRDTLVILHESITSHRDTVYFETAAGKDVRAGHSFRKDSLYRVPVVGLRSNLLLPLLNVGAEVPLSNRFSIGADMYYPWMQRAWMNRLFPVQKYCAQALAASLEARWWLGKIHSEDNGDPRYRLRGHSIGVIATGGYYDLEYDWKGEQGEFLALGLDYMYALPLGKGGVHFEFDLGVGYAVNTYRDYDVRYEGGRLIGKGQKAVRHMVVPLRARFALVVPIHKRKDHE